VGAAHPTPSRGGAHFFHPLPPPTDAEVEAITARVVRRTARLLARRDADLAADDEPDALAIAIAQAEAVQTPLALTEPAREPTRACRPLCAFLDGFSLHAATFVDAADRAGLERFARYLLRPRDLRRPRRAPPRRPRRARFRRPDPTGRTAWVIDGPTRGPPADDLERELSFPDV
jgi:hypothetical protein